MQSTGLNDNDQGERGHEEVDSGSEQDQDTQERLLPEETQALKDIVPEALSLDGRELALERGTHGTQGADRGEGRHAIDEVGHDRTNDGVASTNDAQATQLRANP